jgi:hypothetical protein
MNYDDFDQQAWAEHADAPEQVASRLPDGLASTRTPAQVLAWIRLATHVMGEHLGRWDEGLALLEQARGGCGDDVTALAGLTRHQAALHWCAGRATPTDELPPLEAVGALSVAASALVERGDLDRAVDAYARAEQLAAAGVPDGSPALRALAIGGNNLAAMLQTRPDRSDAQTQAMLSAAQSGLRWWQRAGTWLQVERAHWRIARCRLSAGDGTGAAQAAREGLAVCNAHDAPPFERFFLHVALAQALKAAGDEAGHQAARQDALEAHAQVPQEDLVWCEEDLRSLT